MRGLWICVVILEGEKETGFQLGGRNDTNRG